MMKRVLHLKNSLDLKQTKKAYYAELQKKYDRFTKENELFTILEALDAVNTRTISLRTTDVKSWNLIGAE